jgi:hypothetical protein
MSITFRHRVGQSGNQLFVCILAGIIAHKNGLHILMPSNDLIDFRSTLSDVPDVINRTVVRNVTTVDSHVRLAQGYYQNISLFSPHKDIILNHIVALPPLQKNYRDIVMHIRLDGFNHRGHNSHIIHHRWYTSILDSLHGSYERLFIVMDTKSGKICHKQHKQMYLDMFKSYTPIIVSNSAREDFEFIRSFDSIICSNSTFCWWAAFLSSSNNIYLPPTWESKIARLSDMPGASIVSHSYGYINIDTMQEVAITYQ